MLSPSHPEIMDGCDVLYLFSCTFFLMFYFPSPSCSLSHLSVWVSLCSCLYETKSHCCRCLREGERGEKADGLSQWRPARGTGAGHVTGGYQGDVIALGVRMKGARGRSMNECRERESAGLTVICGTERGKDQECVHTNSSHTTKHCGISRAHYSHCAFRQKKC